MQGGGHSPMSSLYGMGVDSVSYHVVKSINPAESSHSHDGRFSHTKW